MKRLQREIEEVIFSSLVLGGLTFLSFNLSGYNPWIFGIVVFSLILGLAAWVYKLLELWETIQSKFSILKSEGITEVLAIDQYYRRGKVYHLQGKTNKAIKEFKRILFLNPSDSDVYYQLGKIYQEKGKKKEAVKFLERYLQLDKGKKWRDEVEKLLPALREIS